MSRFDGDYKYAAQMRAEEQAEEEFGPDVDYFSLPDSVRDRLYRRGLEDHFESLMDAADNARKRGREGG